MKQLNKINLLNESPVAVGGDDPFANDKLNFQAPVNNMTILLSQVQKPYTVGIFGDWGSGKTSFMRMLQEILKQDGNKFATCWFDAWKYETEDNLILPLLHKISSDFKKIDQKIKNSLIKSASVIGLSFSDIFLKSCTAGAISKNDVMENFEFFEKNSAKFYQHFSDSVQQLEDAFKLCVEEALKSAKKETLVIFIDDLDRCLPEHVINLLEKIKNYLIIDGVNVIFILGVDKTILEKSVIAKYGTDLIDGNKYLEKIINLPFPLPTPKINEVDFINSLFKSYISDYNDEDKEIENKLKDLANHLELQNPRRLRKVIMRVVFYLILRQEENSKQYFKQLQPEIIIYLLLFKEFYPDSYKMSKSMNDVFNKPKTSDSAGQLLSFDEIAQKSCKAWAEIIHNRHKIGQISVNYFKEKNKYSQKTLNEITRNYTNYFRAVEFLYTLSE